jgi:tetratricopeptide (TPR) repeat protein
LNPDPGPEAQPLLTWLDEHMQDPEHVYSVAAAYHWHRQEEDALAMFSRCVELEPRSHLYWFRFSQTLGWAFKWDGALEACEKPLGLHATAQRQYVTARQMLNWKVECLFMLQRYTEAADIYRFVIQIDDFVQRAGSYSQLARCYERIGAYREAVDAREREVRERADSF